MKEKTFIKTFIVFFSVLLLILSFTLDGTGDSGDSVYHFLYAKYALVHPENFFNTWAKPLYVLLAFPFAQFGFAGIKIFNSINSILSVIATYRIAKCLGLTNSWLIPILMILAPLNFALALTGLTEPLFGCLLIWGLYLLFSNRSTGGAILLSFLPFIRSEGLFLLIFIGVYLLYNKKYASALCLALGQIVYALIGYFHFKNLLWFYINNPYSLISPYGHGDWADYFRNLPIVIGPVSCVLLAIGFIAIPVLSMKMRNSKNALIWFIFSFYFMFHVIAWKFGLFASFGMTRIIVAVEPLMAIICLQGYNQITGFFGKFAIREKIVNTGFLVVFVGSNAVYMIINLFGSSGTAGIHLSLCADQQLDNKMAAYIKQKYPDYKSRPIVYNALYLSIALQTDPFDTAKHKLSLLNDGSLPPKSLYIWDDWFSVTENGTKLDDIMANPLLVKDTAFTMYDPISEGERKLVLFESKK